MATPAVVPDRISDLFKRQRANQAAVKRSSANARIAKLKKLRDAILARESKIRDALAKDFRKAPAETEITEIVPVLTEIKDAITHLHDWMRPHKVPTPMSLFGTKSHVY